MPKETKDLIAGLTIAVAIAGIGQFVIQAVDPKLTIMQQIFAAIFGFALAAVLIALNISIRRK